MILDGAKVPHDLTVPFLRIDQDNLETNLTNTEAVPAFIDRFGRDGRFLRRIGPPGSGDRREGAGLLG